MKLISMKDFVFEQAGWFDSKVRTYSYEFQQRILKYAQFFNEDVTLGMFVPCDKEGNVLSEPLDWKNPQSPLYKPAECKQYKQAKDRVIFEGDFEWRVGDICSRLYIGDDKCLFKHRCGTENIEWLSKSFGSRLTLKPTALKDRELCS